MGKLRNVKTDTVCSLIAGVTQVIDRTQMPITVTHNETCGEMRNEQSTLGVWSKVGTRQSQSEQWVTILSWSLFNFWYFFHHGFFCINLDFFRIALKY